MQNHQSVAIFWDFESCCAASNLSGHQLANNIRQIAYDYGSVNLFKAYFGSSETSAKSFALRSELQCSGVSLIDCPHYGKKDVVGKMILADMLVYALDNAAPATIILVSGNRDFAYVVSTLRLRRYYVVLVSPPSLIHSDLKHQASVVVNCRCDAGSPVQEIRAGSERSRSNASLLERHDSDAPETWNAGIAAAVTSSTRHTPAFPEPLARSMIADQEPSNFHTAFPPTSETRPWLETLSAPDLRGVASPPSLSQFSGTPPSLLSRPSKESLRSTTLSGVKSPSHQASVRHSSRAPSRTPSPPPTRFDKVALEPTILPPPAKTSPSDAAAETNQSGAPADELRPRTVPTSFKSLVDQLDSLRQKSNTSPFRLPVDKLFAGQTIPRVLLNEYLTLAQEAGVVQCGEEHAEKWVALNPEWYGCGEPPLSPSTTVASLEIPASPSPKAPTPPPLRPAPTMPPTMPAPTTPAPYAFTSLASTTTPPYPPIPSPPNNSVPPAKGPPATVVSIPPESMTSIGPFGVESFARKAVSPPVHVLPASSSAPAKEPAKPAVGLPWSSPLTGLNSNSKLELSIKSQPLSFRILAEQLEQGRLNGFSQMGWSTLASEVIKRCPTAYSSVGVSRFKQFVALAEEQGLVIMGGGENQQWVSLHPNWHGKVLA